MQNRVATAPRQRLPDVDARQTGNVGFVACCDDMVQHIGCFESIHTPRVGLSSCQDLVVAACKQLDLNIAVEFPIARNCPTAACPRRAARRRDCCAPARRGDRAQSRLSTRRRPPADSRSSTMRTLGLFLSRTTNFLSASAAFRCFPTFVSALHLLRVSSSFLLSIAFFIAKVIYVAITATACFLIVAPAMSRQFHPLYSDFTPWLPIGHALLRPCGREAHASHGSARHSPDYSSKNAYGLHLFASLSAHLPY